MYRCVKDVLIPAILMVCIFSNIKAQKNKVIVTGRFVDNNSADSLTLCYWDNVISDRKKDFTVKREYSSIVVNQSFRFEIDSIYDLSYITLNRDRFRGAPVPLLDLMIVSPGDNVHMEISAARLNELEKQWIIADNGKKICINCEIFQFFGRSAAAYTLQYQLRQETDRLQTIWYTTSMAHNRANTLVENSRRLYRNMNFVLTGGLKYLARSKTFISSKVYSLLKSDLQGRTLALYFNGMNNLLRFAIQMDSIKEIDLFRAAYSSISNQFKGSERPEVLAKSHIFPSTLLIKLKLESALFDNRDIYNLIKDKHSGILQERLLTNYLLDNTNIPHVDSLLKDAVSFVKNENYKEVLNSILVNQKIGGGLFDYSLLDSDGRDVKLSDFKGKIIFIDFWFTGCTGCMQYYKYQVSKAEDTFENNGNVIFVTISVDGNKDKWLQGLRSGEYTSTKAVNLYTNGQGLAHPIIKRLNIIGYPFSIILDRQGKLLINDVEKLRKGGPEQLISTINEAISKR